MKILDSIINVSLHDEKRPSKKKKGDVVTKFLVHLKTLEPY